MRDTWLERDLPVLKAAVEVCERDGDPMEAGGISAIAKLDAETVQRALRALSTEPFFAKGNRPPPATSFVSASQRVRPSASQGNGRHQRPPSKA